MLIYNDITPFKFGLNPERDKNPNQSIAPYKDEEFQAVCVCFL